MKRQACVWNVGVAIFFGCRGLCIVPVHRCCPLLLLMRVREELESEGDRGGVDAAFFFGTRRAVVMCMRRRLDDVVGLA